MMAARQQALEEIYLASSTQAQVFTASFNTACSCAGAYIPMMCVVQQLSPSFTLQESEPSIDSQGSDDELGLESSQLPKETAPSTSEVSSIRM
jgi:hypothetical protein